MIGMRDLAWKLFQDPTGCSSQAKVPAEKEGVIDVENSMGLDDQKALSWTV